jgi:biopolymer transport protein ExbB
MIRKIGCVIGASAALSVGSSAVAADTVENVTYFTQFFVGGGPITWVFLLPLSVITIALSVQYATTIRRSLLMPSVVPEQMTALFSRREFREALDFAGNEPSMLSGVLHAALTEAGQGYASMERAIEEATEERTSRYMRRIEWLNVIGNISPMIGLFGTVTGMIQAFNAIVVEKGMPNPQTLASGISTALVTTFWGLGIAIPALAAFAIFRNRIDVISADVELTAQNLISPFKPRGRGASESGERQSAPPNPQESREEQRAGALQ